MTFKIELKNTHCNIKQLLFSILSIHNVIIFFGTFVVKQMLGNVTSFLSTNK